MGKRRDRRRAHGGPVFPEHRSGPPTVVSVEMAYSLTWPLVDRSPDVVGYDEVEPGALGVSPELTDRLRDLAHRWEVLSRRWIHDEPRTSVSEREEAEWSRDQLELAYDLQHELGSEVEVLVDRVPVKDARRLRGT